MNANTPMLLSTKVKLFRWIIAFAGIVQGALSLGLAVTGVCLLSMSTTGFESVSHREDFAAGMLVGGLALVVLLSAAILAGLSFVCWRVYLKVGHSWQRGKMR